MTTTSFETQSEAETAKLAARLSLWARPGMAVLLKGNLGAGKSTLARVFLRALAGRNDLEVPSPTFTLLQSYDETRVPAFHADLYRLDSAADIAELGLADQLQLRVGLIEWAEKLPHPPSVHCLSITMTGAGSQRTLTLDATGDWEKALARDAEIEAFLSGIKGGYVRHFLEGDASARRYEWLETEGGDRPLLMDMPKRPDGPPVKDGKPYSAIAHLAEDISAVLKVNAFLGGGATFWDYSSPKCLSHDMVKGLALVENLGGKVYGKMLLAGEDMTEPMLTAAELLVDMALKPWPGPVPSALFGTLDPTHYDEEAQLIEVDLLPSWFWPYLHGRQAPAGVNESFAEVWRSLLPATKQRHPQLVLRDFHSPNLIWIPQRQGIKRVGLIDTQDAVLGHAAYDLVSMIQDARVDIPEALAEKTYSHFVALRRAAPLRLNSLFPEMPFDEDAFALAYAILGAQRATKILGIFARLSKRDGKHGYLKHMPRVSKALARNLEHPALATLKDWYKDHLPEALTVKS